MRYWILKLSWSQTDEELVVVKASSKEATAKLMAKFNHENGPRYVSYCGVSNKIL